MCLVLSYTHIYSSAHWSTPEGVTVSVFKDEVTEVPEGLQSKDHQELVGLPLTAGSSHCTFLYSRSGVCA